MVSARVLGKKHRYIHMGLTGNATDGQVGLEFKRPSLYMEGNMYLVYTIVEDPRLGGKDHLNLTVKGTRKWPVGKTGAF